LIRIWKFQTSLLAILFGAVLFEVTIIPSFWAPLRIDFFIGMIIGQVVFVQFSQGFSFVILATLLLQAFSGARLGLIPLVYIAVFLATELLKNVIYLENVFTQALLGIIFFWIITSATALITGSYLIEEMNISLIGGLILTGLVTPVMASIVGRLQTAYEAYGT
jgi:hypothetical protein